MIHPTRRTALALGLAAAAAPALPAFAQSDDFAFGPQVKGDPDAPVTIIEYVSLTCPHCARYHTDVSGRVDREYVETGKARVEFREVYFDRLGLWAGVLARCGGPSKYFGFIDVLLTRQSEWTRAEDLLGEFKRIGRLGGLSDDEVEACLSDVEKQKRLVEMYQGYREDPRLTGTPTLIVADEKVASPTFENMAAAIDAALADG